MAKSKKEGKKPVGRRYQSNSYRCPFCGADNNHGIGKGITPMATGKKVECRKCGRGFMVPGEPVISAA